MTQKVLVAVDGSEASLRAVQAGARWAKALDAVLELIAVIDLTGLDAYDGFYMTDAQLSTIEEKFHSGVLKDAAEKVSAAGVTVRTRLLKGHAAKLLIEAGAADDIEMLLVGRTGKNFLDRLVLGSVSHRVSAGADCPVVLVG